MILMIIPVTGTTNKFRTAAKRALSGSPEEGQPAQDNGANENGGLRTITEFGKKTEAPERVNELEVVDKE